MDGIPQCMVAPVKVAAAYCQGTVTSSSHSGTAFICNTHRYK